MIAAIYEYLQEELPNHKNRLFPNNRCAITIFCKSSKSDYEIHILNATIRIVDVTRQTKVVQRIPLANPNALQQLKEFLQNN